MRWPALAALALSATAAQAGPPDFSGAWRLDPKRSDDVRARVEQAAGPDQVKAGGATGLTILPESGTRSEVERVELRRWMLALAEAVARLEIEQSPEEIKLYLGEESGRIFYFGREHVRQDSLGRKLKCRTRWQGEQLVLEEEGEKRHRLVEVFTLVPSLDQLIHALHFENALLEHPLDVRLVYQRDKPAAPAAATP
jgi:hypothetical protein